MGKVSCDSSSLFVNDCLYNVVVFFYLPHRAREANESGEIWILNATLFKLDWNHIGAHTRLIVFATIKMDIASFSVSVTAKWKYKLMCFWTLVSVWLEFWRNSLTFCEFHLFPFFLRGNWKHWYHGARIVWYRIFSSNPKGEKVKKRISLNVDLFL